MLLPDTTRPKMLEPDVDEASLLIEMPVEAYRTTALTRAALAPLPLRLMPPQSPIDAPVQPGSSADGQATTPALLSLRLVKTF